MVDSHLTKETVEEWLGPAGSRLQRLPKVNGGKSGKRSMGKSDMWGWLLAAACDRTHIYRRTLVLWVVSG